MHILIICSPGKFCLFIMLPTLVSAWFVTACAEQDAPRQEAAEKSPAPEKHPAAAAENPDAILDLKTTIEKVAEHAIPAVAHIEVVEVQEVANPGLPFGNDPLFRYFFNVPQMPIKLFRRSG